MSLQILKDIISATSDSASAEELLSRFSVLDNIVSVAQDNLSKAEFLKATEALIKHIKSIEQKINLEITFLENRYDEIVKGIKSDNKSDITDFKNQATDLFKTELGKIKQQVELKLASVKNGDPGKDAEPLDPDIVAEKAQKLTLQAIKPDLLTISQVDENLTKKGDLIADAISGLLEVKDIKNLQDILDELRQIKTRTLGGGPGNRWLDSLLNVNTTGKVDGSTIIWDATNQYWKVGVASTPVTPTTIILTASGARNDTNTAFTFTETPNIVYVNGMAYRDGQGCSISGTSVTLDSPVGSNGDIFGTSVIIIIPDTGTIDDSNITFVFTSEPTVVIINGTAYRNGHGCTIVGTTVTTDNPVGTGGDIYGFSESVGTTTGTIDDTNLDFGFASRPTLVAINGAIYREEHGWSWDNESLIATTDKAVGTNGDIYSIIL